MLFNEIVESLCCRQFCTRSLWADQWVLVFEMDNIPRIQGRNGHKVTWIPNISDLTSNDWKILPFTWNGMEDDFAPFKQNKGE